MRWIAACSALDSSTAAILANVLLELFLHYYVKTYVTKTKKTSRFTCKKDLVSFISTERDSNETPWRAG